MENRIQIVSKNNEVKAEYAGGSLVVLTWEGAYEEGDKLVFAVSQTNRFYGIRVDDTMDEALVYITAPQVVYEIPFSEKKCAHNPKSFTGGLHYISLRVAVEEEAKNYRNLAKNPMDQHGDPGCYPHAHANVETRGEAVFAARNAIDGILANRYHGIWPFGSWGINQQDDAELTLEFGRPVDFDKIVLHTRADFPHDNWWEQVTFTFSDGTTETVELEKRYDSHEIAVERKGITWLKFGKLMKADDPSPFPALTQIEVFGRG